MPDHFSGADRFLFLQTPKLGADKLLLDSYTGHEAISELFSFQLELLSKELDLKFENILGKTVSFGVAGRGDGVKRQIHGIVTAFAELPRSNRLARYRATVSPSIWKLTRKRQSRIFQKKSVEDILRIVLEGFDANYRLQSTYQPRDYCVQYRESDFEFISRLMEEEGIFYFFDHSGGGDQLVMSDASTSLFDIAGDSKIVYEENADSTRFDQRIFNWQKTQHWESGKYTLRDHSFRLPNKNLEASQDRRPDVQVGTVTHKLNVDGDPPKPAADLPTPLGDPAGVEGAPAALPEAPPPPLEVYDYPGDYAKHFESGPDSNLAHIFDENKSTAVRGMQRIEAAIFQIRGESDVYNLTPGYRFTLERHFNGNGPYVVTSVSHSAREGSFSSEGTGAEDSHFSNIFTCIPSALSFRPQRSTPKPLVRGCQTAYVVGPEGEEIYTDEYGRVKVHFHWDRVDEAENDYSCWVRVASFWAGHKWGAIHLPRIGQEVVVDFLEGDPDRPIIVGSVYNAQNMPPYALPENKTQSTLKSRSSMGGGSDNFNEIRFEDKKGSEEVYFQAEKDLNSLIKNDETRKVNHDRKVKIENDDSKDVTHDLKLTVGHDRTTQIGSNDSTTIGKDNSTTIGGKNTVTITQDSSETVLGKVSVTIMQNQSVTIAGSESHTASSRTTTIAGSDSTAVAATVTLTAGGGLTITSGGPVSITAPMITLTAPMVQAAGVIQCTTLIASAGVVSPMYTPGAGNIL